MRQNQAIARETAFWNGPRADLQTQKSRRGVGPRMRGHTGIFAWRTYKNSAVGPAVPGKRDPSPVLSPGIGERVTRSSLRLIAQGPLTQVGSHCVGGSLGFEQSPCTRVKPGAACSPADSVQSRRRWLRSRHFRTSAPPPRNERVVG